MSGIVAAISWNGDPLAADLLRRMLDRMPHRGSRQYILQPEPGVALGLLTEGEPPARGCLADVRLDNRIELEREIGCESSDSELLKRGYERWGNGLADRLRGDFALAIWDMNQRGLYAARDCFGVRPLYYHASPDWLLLASEMEPILGTGLLEARLEDRAILEYLENDHRSLRETFFASIFRVVPGHWLLAKQGSKREERYWRPPEPDLSPAGGDYPTEFRRLFQTAVADRLRGEGTAVAHLSGGLDSSSIVCMADEIVRTEKGPWNTLTAVSAVYPGLPCDETPRIDAVSGKIQFAARRWNGAEEVPVTPGDLCVDHPCAVQSLGGTSGDLQLARQLGASFLLSGVGGDELLFERGVFRDLAARCRWATLLKQTVLGPRLYSSRTGAYFLWDALRAAVPLSLRHALRKVWPRPPHAPPAWLAPSLLPVWEQSSGNPPSLPFRLPDATRQFLWNWLTRPNLWALIDMLEVTAARQGVQMRYPFLDRRLADFVLGIPFEARLPGGRMKRLLRQAMAGLVPAVVLDRIEVTTFDTVADAMLDQRCAQLKEMKEGNGWLSATYVNERFVGDLLRLLDNRASGPIITNYRSFLLNLNQLELWLRALRGREFLPTSRIGNEPC